MYVRYQMKFIALFSFGLMTLLGCKTVQTSSGEKVPLFHGTIIYDVTITEISDSKYTGNPKAKYGEEMHLTVFKNGDIQRKYIGADETGYDLTYLNLEQNTVLEKFNASDSLFVHSASKTDMIKLNELRNSDKPVKVLDRELSQVAIAAQQGSSQLTNGNYVSVNYWYDEQLKVDKSRYTGVNEELLNYFLEETNGSLYLKYELNYYTHKITFTAKEILRGKYEKEKEKLGEAAPRVSK